MTKGAIAFIDDEPDLCAAAEDWLSTSGFEVKTWSDPLMARAEINCAELDAVVVDLRMPGLMGNLLMRDLRARDPDLPVILMSAHADVTQAVSAMRDGAHDFVEKPYLPEHLVAVLERALEWRRLRRDLARAHAPQSRQERISHELIGRSSVIAALRHGVLQLADAPVDLLLRGPHGAGREALARLIHDLSRRARRPFVALDCRAISKDDMEIELFGFERGALPGRSGERASRFEHANGGTIYLTEIEALAPDLQMRLFRTLQDRAVTRIGGHQARSVDIRLIVATSTDLEACMNAGHFRQDLYFRLAAAGLRAPALAERREDLPQLYLQALAQSAARLRRPLPEPGPAFLETLKTRDWPGNLSELQAEAERHVLGLLGDKPGHIDPPTSPVTTIASYLNAHNESSQPSPFTPPAGLNLAQKLASYEAHILRHALDAAGGSTAKAAEDMGIPRRTLNEKLSRLGLRDGT